MASIVPGFSYDVFISYRHNDNRSGWVTDFVRALKEELAATIKEPVSVYFDNNPYDGLLETHNVDKSLEDKLKCLIFLPILSQTYSDPKSFAWQHEFCAFNKLSRESNFGRDIKLGNGNVSSRILPVKIHDLDADDLDSISKELNSALRAIEMIYREPGVNRPLQTHDSKHDNQNKTDYRNQVNKIANTIKDLIYSIQQPNRKPNAPSDQKETIDPVVERSIAVLPFVNLSNDPSQEYFADGVTENIITELATLSLSRLISRTSVMRYKKTVKSTPEIASELAVKYILEGSVQLHKEKVRISVQLINAAEDNPVWSKVFVENTDDIFAIQANVADTVAKQLHASFNPVQVKKQHEPPTKNQAAYDLFLKGRHAFNQWGVEGYKTASGYFRKAIELDPNFREAYSFLASSYSARMSWNGDLSPQVALENIEPCLAKAWEGGPSDNDFLTKAFIEFFIRKDLKAAEKLLLSALELNTNNATVLYTYSYVLNLDGRFNEAAEYLERARLIDPLTVGYFNYKAISLYLQERYDETITTIREALQLFPTVVRFYDLLARTCLTIGKYEDTIDAVNNGLKISSVRQPSMIAWQAMALAKLNRSAEAGKLVSELASRSALDEKGVNVYLVYATHSMGNDVSAKQWHVRAMETNDIDLIWWNVDPLLESFRSDEGPDFDAAESFINEKLEREMPKLEYHNIDHIRDVVQASAAIAVTEDLPKEEIKLVRIAALLHDIGFIHSSKNHEQTGAEIATMILPEYGFNSRQVKTICGMILATRLPQSPTTQLERILCDADLDYLGRDDFYEIGGKLFLELKSHGAVETDREWNLVQKTFLESHRYHTEFGRINREPEKQKHLQEIIATLKNKVQ